MRMERATYRKPDLPGTDKQRGDRSPRFGLSLLEEKTFFARYFCSVLAEVFHQHDVRIRGLIKLAKEKRFAI
jgi:hypothetical protein